MAKDRLTFQEIAEIEREEIEKARGLVPRGGSSRIRSRVIRAHDKAHTSKAPAASTARLARLKDYVMGRRKGGWPGMPNNSFKRTRRRVGVYKMDDVEKAKGLIRSGSKRLARVAEKRGKGGLAAYLHQRKRGQYSFPWIGTLSGRSPQKRTGVYKSLESLDEAIEKAKGLISGGSGRLAARGYKHQSQEGRKAHRYARLRDMAAGVQRLGERMGGNIGGEIEYRASDARQALNRLYEKHHRKRDQFGGRKKDLTLYLASRRKGLPMVRNPRYSAGPEFDDKRKRTGVYKAAD